MPTEFLTWAPYQIFAYTISPVLLRFLCFNYPLSKEFRLLWWFPSSILAQSGAFLPYKNLIDPSISFLTSDTHMKSFIFYYKISIICFTLSSAALTVLFWVALKCTALPIRARFLNFCCLKMGLVYFSSLCFEPISALFPISAPSIVVWCSFWGSDLTVLSLSSLVQTASSLCIPFSIWEMSHSSSSSLLAAHKVTLPLGHHVHSSQCS